MLNISIIIPNFNDSKFLNFAVNMYQNHINYNDEILIIDDGSTDNSISIINNLQKKYSNIKLISHKINKGVPEALNTGLKHASCDLVFFGSSNDFILKNFFSSAKKILSKQKNCHLFCSDFFMRNEKNNQIFLNRYPFKKNNFFYSKDDIWKIFNKVKNLSLSTCSSIYRTNILREFSFFKPKIKMHCDWFLIQCFALKYGLYYYAFPGSVFNVNEISYSGNILKNQNKHKEIYKEIVLEILNLKDKELINKFKSPNVVQLPNNGQKQVFKNIIFYKPAWKILSLFWLFYFIKFIKIKVIFWDIIWFFLKKLPGKNKYFNYIKIFFLKIFGAKIGKNCNILYNVNIKKPWLLEIDNNVSLLENSNILNDNFVFIKKTSFVNIKTKNNYKNFLFNEKITIKSNKYKDTLFITPKLKKTLNEINKLITDFYNDSSSATLS